MNPTASTSRSTPRARRRHRALSVVALAVKEPDDPVHKQVTVTLVRGGSAGWKVTAIKLESEGCTA